jgi:uncharacterized Rmd1/YagE family protein
MNKFRILIAGSRDFDDYNILENNCNHLLKNKFPNIEVVSGGARGADTLAITYAENYLLDTRIFEPDWDLHGKSAGYRRNLEMAEYLLTGKEYGCIVFWNGESKGSKHMIDICKRMNIPLRIVRY